MGIFGTSSRKGRGSFFCPVLEISEYLGRAPKRCTKGSDVEACAVDRTERRRRGDRMGSTAKAFGLAVDGHANYGADLMPRGVVGGQRGSGEKNHRNVLQAWAGLYNRAQILAGDLLALALCLSENYVRHLAAENVERLLRGGDGYDMVTILFEYYAQRTRGSGIRFDAEHTHLTSGYWRTSRNGEHSHARPPL